MNILGIDLTGRVIIVKENTMTGTTDSYLTRMVKMHSGNGLKHENPGTRIFGKFLKNPTYGPELVEIPYEAPERLATEREIEIAK